MTERSETRGSLDQYSETSDDGSLKRSEDNEALEVEEHEYPPTTKLIPILIGLCFQSFCIALVSTPNVPGDAT